MRGDKRRLAVELRRCCVCRCRGIRKKTPGTSGGILAGARRMRRLETLPGHSDGHRSYYGNYNAKHRRAPVAFPVRRPAVRSAPSPASPAARAGTAAVAWIAGGAGLSGTEGRAPRSASRPWPGPRRLATGGGSGQTRWLAAPRRRGGDPLFGVMTGRPAESTFKTNEGPRTGVSYSLTAGGVTVSGGGRRCPSSTAR
jgi:hypothetical protein